MNKIKNKFRQIITILCLMTFNIQAGEYEDYINGITEIGPYLQAHQSTHTSVGPMNTAQAYYWHNLGGGNEFDEGYFFNSPLGNIADNETQFLSFELNTNTLFSSYNGGAMHLVVSMRGNSFVYTDNNNEITIPTDVQLRGKGPILHHTEGRLTGDGCFGVGVEDFSINAGVGNTGHPPLPLCESYSSLGFTLQDNQKYRLDAHASKGWVAYWLFKKNPAGSSTSWSLEATSGTPAPEQSIDSAGNDSIIIGTAGRRQISQILPVCETKYECSKPLITSTGIVGDQLNINNVYISKWTN